MNLVGLQRVLVLIHRRPKLAVVVDADEASRLALAECALLRAMSDWGGFDEAGNALRLAINVPMIALQKLSIAAIVRDNRPKSARWPGLILDVAEDQVLSDVPLAHEIATHLRIYNVHLAIDRFGRSSGSLERLGELPFAELKIDSSFVAGCADDANQRVVCKAVIDLAHRFGQKAVADGVVRPQDRKTLVEMGCDIGQGAAFGRTLDKLQLMANIKEQTRQERGF